MVRRRDRGLARLGALCLAAAIALAGPSACTARDASSGEQVRGKGLEAAALAPSEHAGVFAAALHSAFDIGPSLTLLLDPIALPRTRGYAGGDTLTPAVQRAIRGTGIVQGACTPVPDERRAPLCEAPAPGYVVRATRPLRMPGDSLLIYVMGERYDTPASGRHPRFRFETAFQLVKRGREWEVVRQARLPAS